MCRIQNVLWILRALTPPFGLVESRSFTKKCLTVSPSVDRTLKHPNITLSGEPLPLGRHLSLRIDNKDRNQMRVKSTKGDNEWNVWLVPEEVEDLVDAAAGRSHKHKVAVLLGTRVGVRAEEYTRLQPADVFRENGEYRITVRGKDTTGEMGDDGKRRDAYLPREVERELAILQAREGLDDTDRYYPVTQVRIRQMVHEAADEAAKHATHGRPEDWRKVSSHDLRRYYAHHLLVRERVNPRVVMRNGGWDTYEAIEPYLSEPTADIINEEMEGVF